MEAESGVAFPHLRTLHRPVADTPDTADTTDTTHEQAHGLQGQGHGNAAARTAPAPLATLAALAAANGAGPDAGLNAGPDAGPDAGLESSLQDRLLTLQELPHHNPNPKP